MTLPSPFNALGKLPRNLFLIGLFFHLLAAWFAVGYHHPDEYFQVFEFASWKLGKTPEAALQWEFGAQIRPALQPALIYFLYKIVGLTNPVFVSFLLRLVSAVAAWAVAFVFAMLSLKDCRYDKAKRWLLYLVTFLWFMPYIHSHFSAENWSGILFFAGLSLLLMKRYYDPLGGERPILPFLFSGILIGLSFVIRFQSGFMIFGLLMWLLVYGKGGVKRILTLITGIVFSIFLGVLADRWFYGKWLSTSWNYFDVNVLQGKAAGFGVSPWWDYFILIIQNNIPPFGIFFLAGIFIFFFRFYKHLLTWICIPFLLAHLISPHKELRFLFPLVNVLPVLIAFAYDEGGYTDRYKRTAKFITSKFARVTAKIFISLNIILIVITCLKPENEIFLFYNYVYEHYGDKKVNLYTLHDEPYNGDMKVYFFRPENLSIVRVTDDSLVRNFPFKGGAVNLIFEMHPEKANSWQPADRKFIQVYSIIPEWLWSLNFNHWLEHTRDWRLYVVE